jgi:hypothetical protein
VRYFKDIQAQALEHKDELLDSIQSLRFSFVYIWTSAKRLTLAPGSTVEFCSLVNRILREQTILIFCRWPALSCAASTCCALCDMTRVSCCTRPVASL